MKKLAWMMLGSLAATLASAYADTAASTVNSRKLMNVRADALAITLGIVSADVDFMVSDSFTLGPTFSVLSASAGDTSLTAYGIGARANYYLSGSTLEGGLILGPYVKYLPTSLTETVGSKEYQGSVSGVTAGSFLSYQWMWNNGFNINLGAGAAYYSLASEVSVKSSSGEERVASLPAFSGILPNAELTVGYSF